MLGDQFYLVALPWLALAMTGSSLALGLVLMAAAIPRAALMLVGGALSDRYDPRSIMIASSAAARRSWPSWRCWCGPMRSTCGTCTCSAPDSAPPMPSSSPPPSRWSPARAGGSARGIERPRDGQHGGHGHGRACTRRRGDRVTGTALGFGIDAVTFLFAVVTLMLIRRPPEVSVEPSEQQTQGTLPAIAAGLRYASADPQIRMVLLAVTAINLAVVGPFFVGLPALVETFEGGPRRTGSSCRRSAEPRCSEQSAPAASALGPGCRSSSRRRRSGWRSA